MPRRTRTVAPGRQHLKSSNPQVCECAGWVSWIFLLTESSECAMVAFFLLSPWKFCLHAADINLTHVAPPPLSGRRVGSRRLQRAAHPHASELQHRPDELPSDLRCCDRGEAWLPRSRAQELSALQLQIVQCVCEGVHGRALEGHHERGAVIPSHVSSPSFPASRPALPLSTHRRSRLRRSTGSGCSSIRRPAYRPPS